jgi:nucleoside-diphosphate-sugar epimerase
VLQLLAQGHDPSSIRIVDFRPPTRKDLTSGPASAVPFVQADMTSSSSIDAAFSHPWPAAVASHPLTVFHTAAVIRPSERSLDTYDRCRVPNLVGTANVLAGARAAGASVFILTSSCSIALRPVSWFSTPPWRAFPDNYAQTMTTDDFFAPLGSHTDFFSNYARSKAEAERLVCAADAPGFRAGTIRPGNGVYGSPDDLLLGSTLRLGTIPTFTAPWVQNWVHGANVALAELQLEAALLGPHADAGMAGRPFLVTDPGPPPRFRDSYAALELLAKSPVKILYPPPVLMLLMAAAIETWCTVVRRLGLKWEPEPPLYFLQPACFDAAICSIIDDADARKRPAEGGIGYRGAFTTMEGVCQQIADWNRGLAKQGGEVEQKGVLEAIPEPMARKA